MWSLPNGANEATPLFHDGVLFVHAFGDKLQALDAATGDLLWQYSRRLPMGSPPSVKRHIVLYGDKVLIATSDVHVVALDVHNGRSRCGTRRSLTPKAGYGMTGGPTIAKGKVIVGTVGRAPGGNFIVALDANTGEEAWRFNTIAKPGEPGGDSWNGVPLEKRNGGSVWVAGSYDSASNLVYFGVAQTYDTGPYRDLIAQSGVTNDLLYTDSTVAINPDTGKAGLALPAPAQRPVGLRLGVRTADLQDAGRRDDEDGGGDVRQAGHLRRRRGGHRQVRDLDGSGPAGRRAEHRSADRRESDQPQARSRATGTRSRCARTRAAPSRGFPNRTTPTTKAMFVPLVESCMDLTPVAPGGRGSLSTGVRWTLRPRPDSDGKYGRLEALNLETKKVLWTNRQRAPLSSGVLATAGGVVFAGALDRVFAAYDDATGKELWRVRLNDVPNSAPISYSIGGRQYVAVVVGNGGAQAATFPALVPEILQPAGSRRRDLGVPASR